MDAGEFDEALFFRAIFGSGARVLLIGRQALIALGLPVLTADYDLWAHIDDEWFTRRYPTALERFAYNRRAYARAVARPIIRRPI